MEQRPDPRLARPYVLDGPDDHISSPAESPAAAPARLPVTRTDHVVGVPLAPRPAPPATTAGYPAPPATTAGYVPEPAVADSPATTQVHPVTPHHQWARHHHAVPDQRTSQARGAGARAIAGLLGAHGMTATFVVIVVGVAAAVLAVAAMKGRPDPPPPAGARGDQAPGRFAGPTVDGLGGLDGLGGPPLPTGTPAIPAAPGGVLPGGVLPGGGLPPVGNAAGAPAGGRKPTPPGPATPSATAPRPSPGAPGAGQGAPGAGPVPVPRPGSGQGTVAPVPPPAVPPIPTPNRPSPSPSPKEPEKGTAFRTIQGESFDGQSGVKIESAETGGGRHAGFISTGDWVRYDGVTFTGATARKMLIRASNGARQNRTGRVELRLDRRSNGPVGSMTIPNNGLDKWFSFSTYSMSIPPTTGVHTVYLTFTSDQNEEFANVDWLTFTP